MTFLDPSTADGTFEYDGNQFDAGVTHSSPDIQLRLSAEGPGDRVATSEKGLLDDFWPHLPALRGYLRRRLPAGDVDDVLQDIFLNIVRRTAAVEVAHPRCYLFQAAQAALVDRHRRQTARRVSCHCELKEIDAPVDECTPLRILLAKDDIRAAEDILRGLPERTQEIIVAVRLEGMSLKSLASRYNISTSAIEKHVTKASKALSRIRCSEIMIAANG